MITKQPITNAGWVTLEGITDQVSVQNLSTTENICIYFSNQLFSHLPLASVQIEAQLGAGESLHIIKPLQFWTFDNQVIGGRHTQARILGDDLNATAMIQLVS